MADFDELHIKSDVESALRLCKFVKWMKIALALTISIAYFIDFNWMRELIVFAVVLMLIFPMGFFDIFIQKLLEYNTRCVEKRQLLNANEANKHFSKVFDEIEYLKRED